MLFRFCQFAYKPLAGAFGSLVVPSIASGFNYNFHSHLRISRILLNVTLVYLESMMLRMSPPHSRVEAFCGLGCMKALGNTESGRP